VRTSRTAVYRALVTEEGLTKWWTRHVRIDGKIAEFGFGSPETVFRMVVEERVPGRKVAWRCTYERGSTEWVGTRIIWDLLPNPRGTMLCFRHANWRRVAPLFAICNTTWGELMHRIKAYAEGGRPGPHFK
jgi:uncharacterized protein YndB with AHSA1/START domain